VSGTRRSFKLPPERKHKRCGAFTWTMKLLGQIFIGLVITTSCLGQKSSDQDAIKKSVTIFYQWYIGTTKDSRYSKYVHGTMGENGKTRLKTSDYFRALDSLGVIGEEFIRSEKERFEPCDSLLRTVPWTTFSTADAYEYDSKCYWLYYYYWTNGQEPHDGVEVRKVTIDRNKAFAETSIYFGDNKSNGDKVLVWLSRINNKWMITKIDR